MKRRNQVIVVGGSGVTWVPAAFARIRRKQHRWKRPRGASFRLKIIIPTIECATAGVTPVSGTFSGRKAWKLSLYGSGPLFPTGWRHSDGRTLRGALLGLLASEFGPAIAYYLSNHGTCRKSPIAVSVSRNNPRRAFVTLTAGDDGTALQLLRELEALLQSHPLTIGNGGPGTHVVTVKAMLTSWQLRGDYIDVAAGSKVEAVSMVPAGVVAKPREGRAGKRSEMSAFGVTSKRVRRLPLQVGAMGAYGYGVLA